MKNTSFSESLKYIMPDKFCLAVSKTTEGHYNVAGFSWFTVLSTKPGKVLLATANKGFTGECIKQTKKISLCFPSASIKKEAMQCCLSSGKTTDKLKTTGLNLISCEDYEMPIIEGCSGAWQLTLDKYLEVDDHTAYIFDVDGAIEISDEPHLLATNGYKSLICK